MTALAPTRMVQGTASSVRNHLLVALGTELP